NDKECEGCSLLTVSQMDPVYFLPTLPMKRAKPIWMTDQPLYVLSDQGYLPPTTPKPLSLWSSEKDELREITEEKKTIRRGQNLKTGLVQMQDSRKRQESFRKSLLNIVMQGKSGSPGANVDSSSECPKIEKGSKLSSNEVDLFRYFYYIHNGVDVSDVQPMSEIVVGNILGRLSATLKKGQSKTLDRLCDEIKEDYILNTKKSILDFVLRDPRKQSEDSKEMNKEMHELDVVPQPWRQTLLINKEKVQKILCVVNPCIRQAIDIWFSDFVEWPLSENTSCAPTGWAAHPIATKHPGCSISWVVLRAITALQSDH
ncbi:Dynein heavy chain 7, axonemal, partial [Bulinus truncatus]